MVAAVMFPHGETVTILTAGYTDDPYSDDLVQSWDDVSPTEVDVAGVGIEPRPSDEPTQDARNAVTSGHTLYMPAGTEIGPQNRVVVRGKTYDVLGEPAVWVSPFTGWAPGVVVQTKLTEG